MISKTKIYDYIVFWASCIVYVFAFIFLCATYLPNSVLHFKFGTPHVVSTLYPIRYDFYVGTPNEPLYRMYNLQGNKAIPYDIRPFTARFLFGLKRDGKVIASELEGIALDTVFMSSAGKYTLQIPANADINNYIHADTLKYNDYRSENVRYLKGKIIMTIEECPTWQQQRSNPARITQVTLVPLNLSSK